MPWKGVTVSEERQRFLQDYRLKDQSVSDLAERFSISRRTAQKWIDLFEQTGESGFHELSRRPHRCPGQTNAAIVQELVELRKARPWWGPGKLLDLMGRRHPRAHDLLQACTRDDMSNQALPYMRTRPIQIAGHEVLAQRVTYVGELGWELYVASPAALAVWDALWQAGEPIGIRAAGYKAIDSLRLEKGYRYWSLDLTPSDDPYSAGLGFCVRLEKGEFLGREAIRRIKGEGLQRKLSTVTIDAEGNVIYGGEAVYSDGRLLGRLRSGGYGYSVGSFIGYVYLPLELTRLNTLLEVEAFGQRVRASVAADLLYDPKGERIRS